jgi:hypothetical protein
MGCPRLRDEAYDPERLEEQLEAAAAEFAREKNEVDPARGRVEISPILRWFSGDFEAYSRERPGLRAKLGRQGELAGGVAFLARYAEPKSRDFLLSGEYKLVVGSYDWSLNER